jgi:dipeptidyl aminopeptidase/acylaminoacyl peptidase
MKECNLLIIFIFLFVQTDRILSQVQPVKVNLSSNGYKLNAQIFHPSAEKPIPAFILMHGYPGGEGDPLGLGKKLSALGINVFIFNCRGMYSSEGEFSFENSMEDIGSAIGFLKMTENINKYNIDTTNIVVGGWSFGGAMALTAAIYNPEIRRIISIAGADESVLGRKFLTDQNFREMFEKMLKETEYPNGPIKVNIDSSLVWLSNLDKYDQVKHAKFIKDRDILLIGGFNDINIVLEEHILPLYRKLRELDSENIEMLVLNTDHSFKKVREELAEKIFYWIKNGTTVYNEQTKNLLIGTWKFISLVGKNSEGEIFHPYGKDLYGRLMYDPNGNMSVFLMRPDRPKFAADDIYIKAHQKK